MSKGRASGSLEVRVREDLETLDRVGFLIIPDLLTPREILSLKRDLQPLLDCRGRNAFEGTRTQRVYAVLAKTRRADHLVCHPRILPLLDHLLEPNFLLSQLQIVNILPGESEQLLHPDDGLYPIPRPSPLLGVSAMWALDDFTETNGATVVVPRSHAGATRDASAAAVPVCMGAGSVLVFLASLWHGGGANRSPGSRLGVTAQYCQPWLRTQENQSLAVPPDVARQLSEPLVRMLGYSIRPPFMGMVDGRHPKRVIASASSEPSA